MTRHAAEIITGSKSHQRVTIWAGIAVLILLPVIALRGIGPSAWNLPADLIFLVGLLLGAGIVYEIARRVPDRLAYVAGLGLAFWAAFLTVWINLAVGIIGSEDNPANLIYAGVLAVAAFGAVLARFQSFGMARAMVAAAIAQVVAFVIALAAGFGFTGPITVFFCALWLISAWLFRRAGRIPPLADARA